MKCPNCGREIKFVHRFLVYRVGDAYPIDDGGVNISTDALCLPETSSEPTASIMEQVGGEDVTYRCPVCHENIYDVWDEDGHLLEEE